MTHFHSFGKNTPLSDACTSLIYHIKTQKMSGCPLKEILKLVTEFKCCQPDSPKNHSPVYS